MMQIFDRSLHIIQLKRVHKKFNLHNFIYKEASNIIIDLLENLSASFPSILIYNNFICNYDKLFPNSNITFGHLVKEYLDVQTINSNICYDEELIPFKVNNFDLIISNLSLHFINDLPGTLIQYHNALKPKGLFIASILGGDTLKELRAVSSIVDQNFYGGTFPRVIPMIDVKNAGMLMQRAKFATPISHTDTVTIFYPTLKHLLISLRNMGQSNCLIERSTVIPKRNYFQQLETTYKELYSDRETKKLKATYEIITLYGTKHTQND